MYYFKQNHITVFQSALYMTTTAVIESNEAIIMTDPNWLPNEIAEIRKFIDQQLGNKDLYIIYTHSDYDHIIGSGAFPEAKVIAAEELKQNPHQDEIMKQINDFDQKYYIKRNYVPTYPVVDFPISANGEQIQIGEVTLSFYKAHGHTHDGLFTVIEPYGIFLAGDYLSDVEFPFIFSDYRDYVDTIGRSSYILNNHDIQYLVPGHGSVTQDKQEMLERVNFSEYYLQQLVKDHEALANECRAKYQFYEGMKSIHFDNKNMAKDETNP